MLGKEEIIEKRTQLLDSDVQIATQSKGLIVGLLGGIYEIHSYSSKLPSGKAVARGNFRYAKYNGITPMVGDLVIFQIKDDSNIPYQIIEVLPRKNALVRPALANVDILLIFVSLKNPAPDWYMLDKFLIIATKYKLHPIIIFSKADLSLYEEYQENLEVYQKLGYTIIFSMEDGDYASLFEIIDHQKEFTHFKEKAPVLLCVGHSGVGKSTFINRLTRIDLTEVGAISVKNKKGKHTTRSISMYPCAVNNKRLNVLDANSHFKADFYLVDSPGFSRLELFLLGCELEDLGRGYVEISEISHNCFFQNCRHLNEKSCAVLSEINKINSKINRARYERYLFLLNKFFERNNNYGKK